MVSPFRCELVTICAASSANSEGLPSRGGNGIDAAREELARYRVRQISIITFIEVLVGAKAGEEKAIRGFLATFQIIELSAEIAKEAIAIRKELRLKIPDAIVYATARSQGCLLVSRNTKEFKSEWPDIRVPYNF
jgi:predicted nucleic acid-binding protein